jgi:hypothetical protein
MHDVHVNQDEYHECNQEPHIESTADNDLDTRLTTAAKSSSNGNGTHPPPGDIRQVMSKSPKKSVNIAFMEYNDSFHKSSFGHSLSLIDRRANGGVAGDNGRIIFCTILLLTSKVLIIIMSTTLELVLWVAL